MGAVGPLDAAVKRKEGLLLLRSFFPRSPFKNSGVSEAEESLQAGYVQVGR